MGSYRQLYTGISLEDSLGAFLYFSRLAFFQAVKGTLSVSGVCFPLFFFFRVACLRHLYIVQRRFYAAAAILIVQRTSLQQATIRVRWARFVRCRTLFVGPEKTSHKQKKGRKEKKKHILCADH